MEPLPARLRLGDVGQLLRGDLESLRGWTAGWNAHAGAVQFLWIVIGNGAYGAAMGWWRSPMQALFVAIKLPLIVLLTAVGNALLNAMLAPLLGLNISFRQSFLAILMSFAVSGIVLCSFSPIVAFLVWNLPPMAPGSHVADLTYAFIMVVHVAAIAFAGIASNLRLRQLLLSLAPSPAPARRVLFAWLAGNLFLGSQLSWILRPFIGSPSLPVQFLRDHPMAGNFYEALFRSARSLLAGQ
jgi:hypothetical protein